MNVIPTNDVFKHLLSLLRIRDKQEIIELFKSQDLDVTGSQIKAWQTMSGKHHPGYRSMPRDKLDAFIKALHESRLIEDN